MLLELEVEYGGLPASPDAVISRHAVRAIIVQDEQLLLVGSRHGDYKFPGGGVEMGESPDVALTREIAEECGITGARIGDHLVRTVERRPVREPDSVLAMTSDYFRAFVDDAPLSVATKLSGYERDLALTPEWVDARSALRVNQTLLDRWSDDELTDRAPWLVRETRVLAALLGDEVAIHWR